MRVGLRMTLLIAALVVAGCTNDAGQPSASEPTRAPTTTIPDLTPAPDELFFFGSGEIGCLLQEGSARCDAVGELSWELPPKPADCEFDWGGVVSVGAEGPGELLCISDTVYDEAAPRLADGQTARLGTLGCTRDGSAITCTQESNGHGFTISRGSFRLF